MTMVYDTVSDARRRYQQACAVEQSASAMHERTGRRMHFEAWRFAMADRERAYTQFQRALAAERRSGR